MSAMDAPPATAAPEGDVVGQAQPKIDSRLSANTIAEIRELFGLFDRANTGKIHVEDLGSILRALHFNPTIEETTALVETIEVEELTLSELMTIVSELPAYPELEDDLVAAFALFDKNGDGFIDAETLRYILTKSYESLQDAEVDALLARGQVDEHGRIHYVRFAQFLMK